MTEIHTWKTIFKFLLCTLSYFVETANFVGEFLIQLSNKHMKTTKSRRYVLQNNP